jgi:hypothetical protein
MDRNDPGHDIDIPHPESEQLTTPQSGQQEHTQGCPMHGAAVWKTECAA